MGRCPEDGQTVLFEATSDRAGDFFIETETSAWLARLAHVYANVYAIYTPELSCDFTRIAREASCLFGESYYTIVSDEPAIEVWKDGQLWIAKIPPGRKGRQTIRQIETSIFKRSKTQAGDQLWKRLRDFVWGDFSGHDFLLEK